MMKKNEAEIIINEEQLISYCFFEDRDDNSDEVVIKKMSDKYVVYATNERAAIVTPGVAAFDNESEALDNFIRRLRALNRVRNSR